MRHWPVWLLLCPLAGCHSPLIRVQADGKFAASLPPVADAGPVVGTPLPHHPVPCDAPRIAVLDVDGLLLNADFTGLASLGENPVALFRERLDAIAADPKVCAVVLRINSPGGGVTATDIMWHDLQAFKACTHLPVVVSLLDVGAAGAYYLATAGDQIVAHPTTVTGGIGVILNYYNLQDTMTLFNIVGAPVKSGKNIDLGSPIAALDDPRRKILQTMADEFHDRFRRVVLQCRPQVDPADATTFDGRVFTAEQALNRKLIDSIGYLDDAITVCQDMAHQHSAQVVFYHRSNDRPWSEYAVTPNVPLQGSLLPLSLPGVDRSKLPSFLYLWQPEPTMEKLSGR
jgi:protease-4